LGGSKRRSWAQRDIRRIEEEVTCEEKASRKDWHIFATIMKVLVELEEFQERKA